MHNPTPSAAAPTSVCPSWHFASTIDNDRFVLVPDAGHHYSGWSVEVHHNDELHIGTVQSKTVWREDEADDVNLYGLGNSMRGWAAAIEPGAILNAFFTPEGSRIEVDRWRYMTEWLAESLENQPTALIIDLGPNDYIPSEDDDEDVVCAQLQVMEDDVFMVRRSRTKLGHLMLASYDTSTVTLDKWYLREHFDDCTDGYLFTRDRRLAAETCVTWFRDNQNSDEAKMGCNYRYADELVPDDPTLF